MGKLLVVTLKLLISRVNPIRFLFPPLPVNDKSRSYRQPPFQMTSTPNTAASKQFLHTCTKCGALPSRHLPNGRVSVCEESWDIRISERPPK
jgi:hypothetical protein